MFNLTKILETERTKSCALCTIVSSKGSTPLKAGAKMLITEDGKIYGTIGGGNLEKKVIENAAHVLKEREYQLFEHNLLQQHNMCCGGTVTVFIESILPPEKLFIFGAGHVGRALANYACSLDFEVYVIDPREEELNKIENGLIYKLPLNYQNVLQGLPFDTQSYIAIMTYDHHIDREILAYCVKRPFAYLGMIGSQRKVEVTRKLFLSGMICNENELSKIDMPMGFNTQANNPQEIAISILAKIIEIKNKGLLAKKNKKALNTSDVVMEQ